MAGAVLDWLLVGAIGMTLGTLPPIWYLYREPRHRPYYAVLAAVTGIAAVAYVVMLLGIGRVPVGETVLFVPRYIDWLLTTPLLVAYLAMLCRPDRRVYGALITADVLVIGFGIAAGLLDGAASWIAYLAGVLAYLGLLYLLGRTLPRQASLHTNRVRAVFTTLRNLTVVLWTIYPAVWVLGPLGFGVLQYTDEVLVTAYLDLISKVGFVVMALNGRDALADLGGSDPAHPSDEEEQISDPDRSGNSPDEAPNSDSPDRRPSVSSTTSDSENAD
jgi:sensory rhodopsin